MKAPRARRIEVPESITSREDLAGADRAITYELPADDARSMTPEDWARGTFEGSPTVVRWILVLGWRFVLGLPVLRERAPEYVLGWDMNGDRLPETLTLRSESGLIVGHNVATVKDSCVVWTTSVHYKRRLAPPIWKVVEMVHLRLMPYILTHAGKVRLRELNKGADVVSPGHA